MTQSKAPTNMLQVQSLHFSYPTQPVFSGWSGSFSAGLTWVQGRNGSGKSTLLKLLAGALPVRHGSLKAAGFDLHSAPLDYRRQVFWCGPDAMAFEHLSAPSIGASCMGSTPGWMRLRCAGMCRLSGWSHIWPRR